MKKTVLLAFTILIQACLPVLAQTAGIKYVAMGDSYTIGESIKPENNWPSLLTKHLQWAGIAVALTANPSVTGYTTQNAITEELPVVEHAKPDFVTVMLGVNDYVQGLSMAVFVQHLNTILDTLQRVLPNKQQIILLTIPDYSVTPQGGQYARGRNVTGDLKQWNRAILQIATARRLACIDVFDATLEMGKNKNLVATDGLHPSEMEHQVWELLVFKTAYDLLK